MAQIKKVNIKGVEYDIAGSGGSSSLQPIIKTPNESDMSITFTEEELTQIKSNLGTVVNLAVDETEEGAIYLPLTAAYSRINPMTFEPSFILCCELYAEGMSMWYKFYQSAEDPLVFTMSDSEADMLTSPYGNSSLDIGVHIVPVDFANLEEDAFFTVNSMVGLLTVDNMHDEVENKPVLLVNKADNTLAEWETMLQQYGISNIPLTATNMSKADVCDSYEVELGYQEYIYGPLITIADSATSSDIYDAWYNNDSSIILNVDPQGKYIDRTTERIFRFKGIYQNYEYTIESRPVYYKKPSTTYTSQASDLYALVLTNVARVSTSKPTMFWYELVGHSYDDLPQSVIVGAPGGEGSLVVPASSYKTYDVQYYINDTNAESSTPETATGHVLAFEFPYVVGGANASYTVCYPLLVDEDLIFQSYNPDLIVDGPKKEAMEQGLSSTYQPLECHLVDEGTSTNATNITYSEHDMHTTPWFSVASALGFNNQVSLAVSNNYWANVNNIENIPLKTIPLGTNSDEKYEYVRYQQPTDNHANLLRCKHQDYNLLDNVQANLHKWAVGYKQYLYSFTSTPIADLTNTTSLHINPDIYRFNLETNELELMSAQVPTNYMFGAAITVYNDKIYLFGGVQYDSNPVTNSSVETEDWTVYVYDPINDTLTPSDIVLPSDVTRSMSIRNTKIGRTNNWVTLFADRLSVAEGEAPISIIRINLDTNEVKSYSVVDDQGQPLTRLSCAGIINDKLISLDSTLNYRENDTFYRHDAANFVLKLIEYNDDLSHCSLKYFLHLSPTVEDSLDYCHPYQDTENQVIFLPYYMPGAYSSYNTNWVPYLAILADENNVTMDNHFYRVLGTLPIQGYDAGTDFLHVYSYKGSLYIPYQTYNSSTGALTEYKITRYSLDSYLGLNTGLDRHEVKDLVQEYVDDAIGIALQGDY